VAKYQTIAIASPFPLSLLLGSGIGGLNEFETQHETMLTKGPSRISPFTIPKLMVNAASGQISIRWGLKGINSAVATACASANNAIGDAFKHIQTGLADIMITGGSEAAITRMGLGGFAALRALSTRNDDPPRASRPFDRDRDGFVLGEGAVVMVAERADAAARRGARIYAEIAGGAITGDAYHITMPAPLGAGAALAMQRALRSAGMQPEEIDYVCAHGTGTPLNDVAETQAIKRVFGEHAYRLAISSPKSMVGHSLGAAGGISALVCVRAIAEGVVPPTANLEQPDPECDLDYVPLSARQMPVRAAMANGFGFGGKNAVVIFKSAEQPA